MGAFKIFDAYTVRARIFPALIASAALIATLAVIVPWDRLSWVHGIAGSAVPIILWVLADIARQKGRQLEIRLYEKWGGKPSTTMLRYSDTSLIDPASKAHHLGFLARKLGTPAPTAAQEQTNPQAADTFYERCGNWLRENTRDTKKFGLLFAENITYGYRRNFYALKPIALMLDVLLFLGAATYFLFAKPEWESELTFKALLIAGLAIAHFIFVLLVATEIAVREAANGYARQLFLCCEILNSAPSPRAAAKKKNGPP